MSHSRTTTASHANAVSGNLVDFAKDLIRHSWEGGSDGDVIQETAEKHGLISRTAFDPKAHNDGLGYAEEGDVWFVFAGPLAADATPAPLTASPSPAGAVPATHVHSWIVGSGDGKSWRTWTSGSPAWTEDREQATRFARREDAEAVHREDEDAWRVVPYQDLPNDADEAYEIGVRDGYEDAVQDLDLATGGDGEFRGSGIPGRAVDVPIMKQRIIDRFVGVPVSPAGAVAPAAGVVEALLDLRDQILRGKRCLTDTGTAVKPIIEVSKVHVLDSAANEIERLAALQPAPHPDTDIGGEDAKQGSAVFDGFVTCTAGDGDPYVKVSFRTLTETQAFHRALLEAIPSIMVQPAQAPDAQGGVVVCWRYRSPWIIPKQGDAPEKTGSGPWHYTADVATKAARQSAGDEVQPLYAHPAALGSALQPAGVVDPWSEVKDFMKREPKFDWNNNQSGSDRQHYVDVTLREWETRLVSAVRRAVRRAAAPLPSPSASHAAPRGGE